MRTSPLHLAIGVLSTTAVILFVGLILLNAQPATVHASGMLDRGGDYIMLTGDLWEQEELVYVIDAGSNRMISYRYNKTNHQIEVGGGQELEAFLNADAKSKNKRGRSSRRRP